MTERERLLRVFNQLPTDRVPVAPFIHINCVQEFFGSKDIDIVAKTIDVYKELSFDIVHRNCTPVYSDVELKGENWKVEITIEQNDSNRQKTTIINTPDGPLKEVWRSNQISEYEVENSAVEYLIKSEEDFEKFVKYQPPVEKIDTSAIKRAKALLDEDGIVSPWAQGAFCQVAYYFRRLDELFLDAMTNPHFFNRVMAYFQKRNKAIITQLIDAGADVICCNSNMASGKLVDDKFFRKYIFNFEKEITDFIQDKGVPVLYHNCGHARSLFPVLPDLGLRAYESLTPPPYGDTILEDALEAFGPETTLCGGIDQIDFLREATQSEIQEKVKDILTKAKVRGNFILGTSDYFNEGTPHENMLALSKAGRKYGQY